MPEGRSRTFQTLAATGPGPRAERGFGFGATARRTRSFKAGYGPRLLKSATSMGRMLPLIVTEAHLFSKASAITAFSKFDGRRHGVAC